MASVRLAQVVVANEPRLQQTPTHAHIPNASCMCMAVVLGIDIGTTNVKVVLVEKATFSVLHQQTRRLGSLEDVDTPGAAERSVSQILRAVEDCMSGLEEEALRFGEVTAIGICGQMHGCVLWNSTGCKLFNTSTGTLSVTNTECSNLFTWQDTRCDPSFISSLPKVPSEEKSPVSAGYGCATLAWLHHRNPEMLAKYDRAGTIMDLVVSALCSGGKGEVTMSSQNAMGWGYFNLDAARWQTEQLEGLFPLKLLPVVVDAPHVAGQLMSDWHQIPRGTKICVAMGDLQCSVYAAQPELTDAVLNMGTASQLALIKPDSSPVEPLPPSLPNSVTELPYFNGSHLLVAAALGGGKTISLFVETLQSWMTELMGTAHESFIFEEVYKKLMELADEKLETPLRMDPRVWGERHAPEERGQVWNVGPGSLSLGDVSSAVVRGLVDNLRDMMSPPLLDHYKVKRVLGSGKLLQKYSVFQKHIQQVFNLPLVLKEEVDAPLGAAIAVAQL